MTALSRTTLVLVAGLTFLGLNSTWAQTPSPAGAQVHFINLKDGQEVKSSFLVQFGLTGMDVAPAGVEKPNTGHHHLLIDTKLTDDQQKEPVPADDTHKHFGGGQTETTVTLLKGKIRYSLCSGIGHISHVPPVKSQVITITVQ